jgi:hypothetical protein
VADGGGGGAVVFVIFNVVIGGIGTIEGPILGTIVFFVLRAYLTDFGSWYLMLLGGLSIVIILVDRRGLWGLIRRFLLSRCGAIYSRTWRCSCCSRPCAGRRTAWAR